MKVLIGCEESQEVCKAFRALGHEAYSCDLQDCSGGHPEWHLKMDVRMAIIKEKWDAAIFFPDCTFITSSGLHWNGRIPGRKAKTEKALEFVCQLLNCGIPKIAIENPIGCISTRIFKHIDYGYCVFPTTTRGALEPTQIIQPYQFGEDASKATCLWLFGLPALKPTMYIEPRIVNGKKRWGNQTDSGQNKLAPSDDRAKIRSRTYLGIARAMAEQWGTI